MALTDVFSLSPATLAVIGINVIPLVGLVGALILSLVWACFGGDEPQSHNPLEDMVQVDAKPSYLRRPSLSTEDSPTWQQQQQAYNQHRFATLKQQHEQHQSTNTTSTSNDLTQPLLGGRFSRE